jgi:hypothetical protein
MPFRPDTPHDDDNEGLDPFIAATLPQALQTLEYIQTRASHVLSDSANPSPWHASPPPVRHQQPVPTPNGRLGGRAAPARRTALSWGII